MDQNYILNTNLSSIANITLTMDNSTSEENTPAISMGVFLKEIERKAYHLAFFAVGNRADALDLLQDAMIKLVTKYQHRPAEEWKPLFYKILTNRIKDWHRHQKVRNLLFFWKPRQTEENVDSWPEVTELATDNTGPEVELAKIDQQTAALASLKHLSEKQLQCFLLRSWEGLSVAKTAEAMGCSQGSVKTHYFRAVRKLKTLMAEDHEITF